MRFDFLYAIKKIFAKPITTIGLILSFFSVFILVSSTLGYLFVSNEVTTFKMTERCKQFNVIVSTSGFDSRFFLSSEITVKAQDEANFFTGNFINNDEVFTFYAGSITDFKKFSSISSKRIIDNEVIISYDYAKKHNVNVGDTIKYKISGKDSSLKIIEIAKSDGLLEENTFYLSKTFISRVLGLNGALYIDYLANIKYFKVDNASEAINELKNLDSVKNYSLDVNKTVDEANIIKTKNALNGLLLFMMLIVTILESILLECFIRRVIFETKDDYELIKLLGGGNGYYVKITSLVFVFAGVISFILAIFPTFYLIKAGLSIYSPRYIYQFDYRFILSLFVGMLYLLIMITFDYLNVFKKHREKIFNGIYLTIISGLSLIVLSILLEFLLNKWLIALLVISLFTFVFLIKDYLFILIKKVFSRERNSFEIYNLSKMSHSKIYKNSLKILLTCNIFIFISLSLFYSINTWAKGYDNYYHFNGVVTKEVSKEGLPVFISGNTSVNGIEMKEYVISLDYQKYDEYFTYDLSSYEELYTNEEVIVLPEAYRYLYGLKENQIVKVDLGSLYGTCNLRIVGFIKNGIELFAFTNIKKPSNSFLVKEESNLNNGTLSGAISIKAVVNHLKSMIDPSIKLISIILTLIIITLVFIIFDNSIVFYEEVKKEYYNMELLGLSRKNKSVMILKETLVSFLVVLIISVSCSLIFIAESNAILYLFNVYYDINNHLTPYVIGTLISLFLGILSNLVLFLLILKSKDLQNKCL